MQRYPNPLVADFLEIAEALAQQKGLSGLRQAAMRRAVSTAYYALFYALCYVCADGIGKWSKTHLVERTYRVLDHGLARKRLALIAGRQGVSTDLKRISLVFGELQDRRHDADYERPKSLFNKNGTLAQIEIAKEAIDLIFQFDSDARQWLAIELLVVKTR